MEGLSCPGRPHKDLLGFSLPFSDTSHSGGEVGREEKGNQVLDRTVNHQPGEKVKNEFLLSLSPFAKLIS